MKIYKLNRHLSNGYIRSENKYISLAITFKLGGKLIYFHRAVFNKIINIKYYFTIVPIFSPITAFIILSVDNSNTCIGILLSIHKDVAVESITFNSLCKTSK